MSERITPPPSTETSVAAADPSMVRTAAAEVRRSTRIRKTTERFDGSSAPRKIVKIIPKRESLLKTLDDQNDAEGNGDTLARSPEDRNTAEYVRRDPSTGFGAPHSPPGTYESPDLDRRTRMFVPEEEKHESTVAMNQTERQGPREDYILPSCEPGAQHGEASLTEHDMSHSCNCGMCALGQGADFVRHQAPSGEDPQALEAASILMQMHQEDRMLRRPRELDLVWPTAAQIDRKERLGMDRNAAYHQEPQYRGLAWREAVAITETPYSYVRDETTAVSGTFSVG